jgi:hypothetical protein
MTLRKQRQRSWDWICEFCFKTIKGKILPDSWDWVWQSAVCPECLERVKTDGGFFKVPGGAYAGGKADPRAANGRLPS